MMAWTLLIGVSGVNAGDYHVTFEERDNGVRTPASGNRFYIVNLQNSTVSFPHHYLPPVDANMGTPQGAYAVTMASEGNGILYGRCMNPAGSRCTLRFSYWVSGVEPGETVLDVHWIYFCHTCSEGASSRSPEFKEVKAAEIEQWVNYEMRFGPIHSMFVVAFAGTITGNNSVLALDNISITDCQIEAEMECGSEEFQCPHTTMCISRLLVCDFQDDCLCGEDETRESCEVIPEQGMVNFADCDFEADLCFWYNVESSDAQALPWKLRTAQDNARSPNRNLPLNNSINWSYVYASPDESSQPQWSSVYLRSVDFPAPPNIDGACVMRFRYWLSGNPKLTIELVQLSGGDVRQLWTSDTHQRPQEVWTLGMATINDVFSTPTGYVLQARVEARSSPFKQAVALTNISLTLNCFPSQDPSVRLTPCGALGPEGPTQDSCRAEYRGAAAADVTVRSDPPFGGAQEWTVPTSAKYSLQVYGARGGRDNEGTNSMLTHGAHVHSKVALHSGDRLLVVVGQMGEDSKQAFFRTQHNSGQKKDRGGGGGGGATWVYVKRVTSMTQEPELLVMAGGGAGMDYLSFPNVDGNVTVKGYNSTLYYTGQPGGVYVHPSSLSAAIRFMSHSKEGVVEIQMANRYCPCDFLCKWHRPEMFEKIKYGIYTCLCPRGRVLAEDQLSCVPSAPTAGFGLYPGTDFGLTAAKVGTTVAIVLAAFMGLVIVTAIFLLYVMRSAPQDRLWSLKLVLTRCLRNRSQSLPLHPLTALPARVMHVNPNYSFITSKLADHKLAEIPRDNIRMSTQLGHGAFGEVYKAFLSGMTGTEREVAVAIKTLPPLCSEQTELDFFMEAFIISKFHHPNIVQLLGVCFDQNPRYIVLELLEGGNLKSFLRENRPSQGNKSKLTAGDLLAIAKDVCCGCCYLEEHHFIHRDIAARNCLLTSKGPDRRAKIADFGMSRDVYRADYYKKEGRALLPLKWMPPEAFMEGIFTSKTDIWSFGVVLWEIFTMGYMPYPALGNTEVMNFIYIGGRLDCPDGCPPSVYNLMLSCWKQKSDERPTFSSVRQSMETILQDTATMSQHLPAFQLPHLNKGCSSRNLKLLNHPVPDLGFQLDISSQVTESACTEPLLKLRDREACGPPSGPREGNGLYSASAAGRRDVFCRRTSSLDSDSASSRGSCSSLEPLLPHWGPPSPHPRFMHQSYDNASAALDSPTCRSPSPDQETDPLIGREEKGPVGSMDKDLQGVRLPPAMITQRPKPVSMCSLSTLEEKDETSTTCEDCSTQNYSSV